MPIIRKFLGDRGTKLAKSLLIPKELQINKNGRHFVVNSEKDYFFWRDLQKGKWESSTFTIFDKFLNKQHSYIDIGGWIGPTVLYGCQLARHCYAVEPDPIAFQELKNNVELNQDLISRITLSNIALSNSSGAIRLYQKNNAWGASGSSILFDKTKKYWKEVKSTTFQQFIEDHSITNCNFIKMDIEGGEFIVLPTMFDYLKTNKPTLLLELHPMFVDKPIQKLEDIRNVLNIYDYVYDEELKDIDIESILFSFENEASKTLKVVLASHPKFE